MSSLKLAKSKYVLGSKNFVNKSITQLKKIASQCDNKPNVLHACSIFSLKQNLSKIQSSLYYRDNAHSNKLTKND